MNTPIPRGTDSVSGEQENYQSPKDGDELAPLDHASLFSAMAAHRLAMSQAYFDTYGQLLAAQAGSSASSESIE